jgi:hypothetical protein
MFHPLFRMPYGQLTPELSGKPQWPREARARGFVRSNELFGADLHF